LLYIVVASVVITFVITAASLVLYYGRKTSILNKYEVLTEMLRAKISDLEQQLIHAKNELQQVIKEKFDAEKEAEIARTRLSEFDKRLYDFEQNKKESLEGSKAAIFEIANQLSSKLISDHRRESEEARQKSFEKFKEATENYHKHFEQVVSSVSALNSKVQESREIVDVVKRALLSPGGAGSLAEITLENILKASGLLEGKDFQLQYSINNAEIRQRPDAVVFLPSNNLFIIDSKASKFFLESEISENLNVKDKLMSSMRTHLKQLVSKEYQTGVIDHLRAGGHKAVNHVSTIMFLPSESMIDKLQKLDHEFLDKAWQQNIFPAGPAGLINLLSHAKFMISEHLQVSNHEHIITEVKNLLAGLFVLSESARKLGANVQSLGTNFDKFAGTFNRTILSKVKKLNKLGIAVKSGKQLPSDLDRFQVINLKQDLIEIEPTDEERKELDLLTEKEEA
jgi:DNA recombination protein RmuC